MSLKFPKFNFRDIFAPWVLFPIIYILYFSFGSLKLTIYPSPSTKSIVLAFMGLIFYLLGSYVVLCFKNELLANRAIDTYFLKDYITKAIRIVIILSLALISVAIIIQAFNYGMPILNPAIRGGQSIELLPSGVLYAIFAMLPLSLCLYVADKLTYNTSKSYLVIMFILGAIATLFTAYRAIIVLYSLTFFISLSYLFRKMSSRLLLPFAAFIGFAIIGIQQYRLYKTYGLDNTNAYFSHINPSGYPDALIAAHLPCHVGATVFSDIVNFSSFSGSLHGKFTISIFETILPGIQMGPRTFISLLRETSLASSTTPSILGGPYLDFGVLGIALFMFLVGLLLTVLYLVMESSQTPFNSFCYKINVVSYSYLLSISIISIHSGLLDPITIFSIVFMIFLQSLANGWFTSKGVLFGWLLALFIFVIIMFSSIVNPSTSFEESELFEFCSNNIKSNTIYLDQCISTSAQMFQNNQFQTLYSVYSKSLDDSVKSINLNYVGICVTPNVFYNYSLNHQFEASVGVNAVYANDRIKLYKLIYK
jgi:oligosaccharide repeat unit polymerase